MVEKEKTYYVGIAAPTDVREKLLHSSKEMISVLKRYDSMVEIRQDKIEQTVALRKVINEIKQLQSVLKQRMPEENGTISKPVRNKVRVSRPTKVLASSKMVKRAIAQARREEKDPEIASLEAELNEIESRLNRLGKR